MGRPLRLSSFASATRSLTPVRNGGVDDGPPPRSERAQDDRALFARYLDTRDPVDREILVERFLPLARQLARRYQRPEEPFDDLFQVACLGLVKAIDRFDLSRDVAFSSYAVPTILGEIKRYFRDRTWSVRVPRDLQELALRVDRKVAELSTDLRRTPTVPELAEALGAQRGGDPRGARGVRRLPGHVAVHSAWQRRRGGGDARRHGRDGRGRVRAGRGPRHARAAPAGGHATRPRGAAAALRGRPHPGRDRRAHRRLADAGLADHPPVAGAVAHGGGDRRRPVAGVARGPPARVALPRPGPAFAPRWWANPPATPRSSAISRSRSSANPTAADRTASRRRSSASSVAAGPSSRTSTPRDSPATAIGAASARRSGGERPDGGVRRPQPCGSASRSTPPSVG